MFSTFSLAIVNTATLELVDDNFFRRLRSQSHVSSNIFVRHCHLYFVFFSTKILASFVVLYCPSMQSIQSFHNKSNGSAGYAVNICNAVSKCFLTYLSFSSYHLLGVAFSNNVYQIIIVWLEKNYTYSVIWSSPLVQFSYLVCTFWFSAAGLFKSGPFAPN